MRNLGAPNQKLPRTLSFLTIPVYVRMLLVLLEKCLRKIGQGMGSTPGLTIDMSQGARKLGWMSALCALKAVQWAEQ